MRPSRRRCGPQPCHLSGHGLRRTHAGQVRNLQHGARSVCWTAWLQPGQQPAAGWCRRHHPMAMAMAQRCAAQKESQFLAAGLVGGRAERALQLGLVIACSCRVLIAPRRAALRCEVANWQRGASHGVPDCTHRGTGAKTSGRQTSNCREAFACWTGRCATLQDLLSHDRNLAGWPLPAVRSQAWPADCRRPLQPTAMLSSHFISKSYMISILIKVYRNSSDSEHAETRSIEINASGQFDSN